MLLFVSNSFLIKELYPCEKHVTVYQHRSITKAIYKISEKIR